MTHFVYVNDSGSGERRLCEVVNLYDEDNDTVEAPSDAIKAVIKWDDEAWVSFLAGEGNTLADYVVRGS